MRRHRRTRRKKRDQGSVELNLAAMLDMAFQLLTFFILTFRPAPIEGQLALHLPPPVPQTNVETQQELGTGTGDVLALDTLHLTLMSDTQGDVTEIKVEQNSVVRGPLDEANVQRLDQKLQAVFAIQQIPYDRVQIAVDGRARYGELMKVIDVCHRQKLVDGTLMQKISFTEFTAGESAEGTSVQ